MSIPGVPSGLRRQVRDAFINALRNDPKLANKRVIKTWITWDKQDGSVVDPAEAAMPAIQIRMLGGPVERVSTTRQPGKPMSHADKTTITMMIELWTSGPDQGDQADVADMIYSALAPQDTNQRAELQEKFRQAGIKDWRLASEILPSSNEAFSKTAVAGQGSYQLTVFFYS